MASGLSCSPWQSSLPLGRPGQATVSSTIPVAGILGSFESLFNLLRVLAGIWRFLGDNARLQHIQCRNLGRVAPLGLLLRRSSFSFSSLGSFSSCSSHRDYLRLIPLWRLWSFIYLFWSSSGDNRDINYAHINDIIVKLGSWSCSLS